jgi:hypothetical protein
MTYQLRVVPMKKRRGKWKKRMRVVGCEVRFSDRWLGRPLMEERIFGNLSGALRGGLDAISSPATHPKGAILFVEGDKPMGVFVLRSGRVQLSAGSVHVGSH